MARELVGDLKKGGALLTLDDLAQYNVVEREPVVGTFHNFTVISAPPPSSGGIVLISALNILESYPLATLGDRSAAWVHLATEAWRRAYMDRADYLGDPDYNTIPVAALTAKNYAAAWRESILPDRASPSATLTAPRGLCAGRARHRRSTPRAESPDTTHYSVVDQRGQCRRRHHHAQRQLRLARCLRLARLPAQRRDGRLRLQARHRQHVWPGAGAGQRHRARQAPLELHDAHHHS